MQATAVSAASSGVGRALSRGVKQGQSPVAKTIRPVAPDRSRAASGPVPLDFGQVMMRIDACLVAAEDQAHGNVAVLRSVLRLVVHRFAQRGVRFHVPLLQLLDEPSVQRVHDRLAASLVQPHALFVRELESPTSPSSTIRSGRACYRRGPERKPS